MLQSFPGTLVGGSVRVHGEPQHRVDYELASHYTSTHPASKFTQVLTAQQIGPDVRRILRNREYSEDRGGEIALRTLADDDEVLDVLAATFGLRVSGRHAIPAAQPLHDCREPIR